MLWLTVANHAMAQPQLPAHLQTKFPATGRRERRQQQERHRLHRAYGRAVGVRAVVTGASNVAREEGRSRSWVRYWEKKVGAGPAFHGGEWGGLRRGYVREGVPAHNRKNITQQLEVRRLRHRRRRPRRRLHGGPAVPACGPAGACVSNPRRDRSSSHTELGAAHHPRMGLELAPATVGYGQQVHRREPNLLRRVRRATIGDAVATRAISRKRCNWRCELTHSQLKFLDEASFNTRDIRTRRRCAPVGREIVSVATDPSRQNNNVILLTSLEHEAAPLFYSVNQKTTSSWDFLYFLLQAILAGYIGAGDILVLDNARIHTDGAAKVFIESIINGVKAHMVMLPTYSPEFSPCENVFGWAKAHLRNHYTPEPVAHRLQMALARLPYETLVDYYDNCTNVAIRRLARGY